MRQFTARCIAIMSQLEKEFDRNRSTRARQLLSAAPKGALVRAPANDQPGSEFRCQVDAMTSARLVARFVL